MINLSSFRTICGLGALALLAACSGGDERPSVELEIAKGYQALIEAKRNPPEAPPVLTRALLDTIESPYIEVTVEKRDQSTFIPFQTTHPDPAGGQLELWRTGDNVTLSFRGGVLAKLNGLGGALISSDTLTAPGSAGPVRSGERSMHYSLGDYADRSVTLACELQDLGPATITVVERAFATRHLRELCSAGAGESGGQVVNDYWIDSARGVIWQSRQWAGPEIGYLRIRRLTL